MKRWSQASVATSSSPPFDIDLHESEAAASMRIYFCGRPARSTGVVNLRLLLGDGGYTLTEKRHVKDTEEINDDKKREKHRKRKEADKDADSASTIEEEGSSSNTNGEKKSLKSTYRMCSSEGLPPGCFHVKHGRHYWVMRAIDGGAAAAEQVPSPQSTEGGQTLSLPTPSSVALQKHGDAQNRKNTKTKKEKTEVSEERNMRERSRHTKDSGKEDVADGHDVNGNPVSEIFKAVEAAGTTLSPNVCTDVTEDVVGDVEATLGDLFFSSVFAPPSVNTFPPEEDGTVDGDRQKPAEAKRTKKRAMAQRSAEINNGNVEESAKATPPPPRRRGRPPKAAHQMEEEQSIPAGKTMPEIIAARTSMEHQEGAKSANEETASQVGKRREKRAKEKPANKTAAPEEPPQKQQQQYQCTSPQLESKQAGSPAVSLPPSPEIAPTVLPPPHNAAPHDNEKIRKDSSSHSHRSHHLSSSPSLSPHRESSPPLRRSTSHPILPVAAPLQKDTTKQKTAKKSAQPAEPALRTPPSPRERESEEGEKMSVSPPRKSHKSEMGRHTPSRSPPSDTHSPAIQPLLSPHVSPRLPPTLLASSTAGRRPSNDMTPPHGRHRSSPDNNVDTTSPTLLYSNRSSGKGAPQQRHPSSSLSVLASAPAVRSTSSSTRLAPLTSPHLRQYQQKLVRHDGSLQYSDTDSLHIIPQDSPALGFTQVHNTLAEEFSLDPSEGATSSTVSEYLYDVEG